MAPYKLATLLIVKKMKMKSEKKRETGVWKIKRFTTI
jgi:hypothetical protein